MALIKKTPAPQIEHFPEYLKEKGKFCLWRYEEDKTRGMTKVPYNPYYPQYNAKSDHPETFSDLTTAAAKLEGFNGLGVGLFDGVAGIDIDHCIDGSGKLSPMAQDIINVMEAYTEISPSGEGIRIFFLAPGFSYDKDIYYIKNSDKGLELYIAGMTKRYLTITGNVMQYWNLADRSDRLQYILDKYMRRQDPAQKAPEGPATAERTTLDITDQELLAAASRAKNGALFDRLWAGDITGYPSHSEADQALCNMLAFWTGKDAGRMDALFRQSALYREKWDRQQSGTTYGAITIEKAIARCHDVYTPPRERTPDAQTAFSGEFDNLEVENPITAVGASEYLTEGLYEEDIEYFKKYKDRKTGFRSIDKYLTLYPGLAVLGGASSLGKTTFIVNLIDRLLIKGETVLYFSLEQLPIEIITKSLTRRLYEKDPATELINTDIKNGAYSQELEEVKKEYAAAASNYHIITGSFRTTAADIVEYVEGFRADHGGEECKPVVIIDYLQLIAPSEDFKRAGIREYTDENLKILKDMQKRNELFVVAVSSFNRSSNYVPVSYESFKETGMIEFTCDYVWGLQLSVLDADNDEFYTIEGSQGGIKERPLDQKRRIINEEQGRIPKNVEFVCLKNRNGKQFFKAFFLYYPQYDCYIETVDTNEFAAISATPGEPSSDAGWAEYKGSSKTARKKKSKRDRQREKLIRAYNIAAAATEGEPTLLDIAEAADVRTNTVLGWMREFGGCTIDGKDIEPAGADKTVNISGFVKLPPDNRPPFSEE